jgi:hypothetical protein
VKYVAVGYEDINALKDSQVIAVKASVGIAHRITLE